MFEHLDDPVPFRPGPALRRRVAERGRRLRWRRRLAATAGGLAVTVAAAGVGGAVYVERRDAAIDRTDIATTPSLDGAVNVLLVGTDGRPEVGGERADTIMVVRLRPDGTVGLLSVPRDLVDPATQQRLSQTIAGGPQGVVDAVDRMLGIPVDHYVEIGYLGLADLVDDLGGLRLRVDAPLRDEPTGLDLGPSACAMLDGDTTVALLRARHVEGDPTSDLGRTERGRAVVTAAVAQLADVGADPAALDRITRTLADHAVVDGGLDLDRMVELARVLAAAGPAGVESVVLPLVEWSDGASVAVAPDAGPVIAAFGGPGGPAPAGPPGGDTPPPPLGPC